jgi:hypothetical protein
MPDGAILSGIILFGLGFCSLSLAECPIKTIMIKGRVEREPAGSAVRIELVYPKGMGGDSGETGVDEGKFSIPVQFFTQSHRPGLNGWFEKCGRKPISIHVLLMRADPTKEGPVKEYDRVVLDLARDFTMVDSDTYELKQKAILKGPQ